MKNRSSEWAKSFVAASGKKFSPNDVAVVEVPEHIRVQNYRAAALVNLHGQRDDNAVVGYDAILQTFFLHAFENEQSQLLIWLGARAGEFPATKDLIAAATDQGIVIEAVYGPHAMEWLPSSSKIPELSANDYLRGIPKEDRQTFERRFGPDYPALIAASPDIISGLGFSKEKQQIIVFKCQGAIKATKKF